MKREQTPSITNMSLDELEALCTSMHEPPYRAKQILSWVYSKGAINFSQMSNLPHNFRKWLEDNYQVFQTKVDTISKSTNGTEKFVIALYDENEIECVLLREGKRITACVSTQVGCAMGCCFCASGLLGLQRNLSAGEIVEQPLHIMRHLSPDEHLTNIVFMGIGEPLANYDNVIKAIRIMNAEWGLGIGVRHITISTVGIIDGIRKLAHEGLKINLAISLHAADDVTRSKIIPSNKKTGIENILTAAREYFDITKRDISFEYTLIDGINDSKRDAESLAKLIKGIQCNVNILPLNPIEELTLNPPSQEVITTFCKTLEKHGIVVTLRRKKGDKINAACGQLRLRRHKILWKNT